VQLPAYFDIFKQKAPVRKLTHPEISKKRLKPEEIDPSRRIPLYGLLDNIRSLYNVGSMFRTSDGVLLSHLYLTGFTPAPPRKEIEKTALGATLTIPWSYHRDPLEAIADARRRGARICVLEQTDASIPYHQLTPGPLCLVVGNELTGVSENIIQEADLAIDIPMIGTKQSLNAAVAFGIAVFAIAHLFAGMPHNDTTR
jgi:tRNA G18 (ribose-2'-O)-methylase SpoU